MRLAKVISRRGEANGFSKLGIRNETCMEYLDLGANVRDRRVDEVKVAFELRRD